MIKLLTGDCRDRLRELPDGSIDSVVTDPPYGLSKEPDIAEVMKHWLADDDYVHGSGGFMGRCYHPDTEVLGPSGWHHIYDVSVGDILYTMDIGVRVEAVVTKCHSYEFHGDLVRVRGRSTDQLITSNHELWISRDNGSTWVFCSADNLPKSFLLTNQAVGTSSEAPTTSIQIGGKSLNALAFMRFLGLWLGDGYVVERTSKEKSRSNWIGFSVKKERKRVAIHNAMVELGIPFKERDRKDLYTASCRDTDLMEWLCKLGKAQHKHIPVELLRLHPVLLESLYSGLIDTDGTVQGSGQEVFFTSSKRLADDFQHLCFLTGRSCTVKWRPPEEGRKINGVTIKSDTGCFVSSVLQRGRGRFWMERDGRTNRSQPAAASREPYDGQVHCVTLASNHVLLTRLNGRTVWSGNSWDSFVPGPSYWREVFRVMKPGAQLLAFGGTRTYDLLVVALRFAGFEIRDQLQWLYGSGFPKSLDVGKAIDKTRGSGVSQTDRQAFAQELREKRKSYGVSQADVASWFPQYKEVTRNWERLDIGFRFPSPVDFKVLQAHRGMSYEWDYVINDDMRLRVNNIGSDRRGDGSVLNLGHAGVEHFATTPEAKKWDGWGTALKPAHEVIVLARKPLSGTVAANVLEHGTGALNIDASRVGSAAISVHGHKGDSFSTSYKEKGKKLEAYTTKVVKGRWPANVIVSHHGDCVQVGVEKIRSQNPKYKMEGKGNGGYQKGWSGRPGETGIGFADADGMETVEAWDCHPDCPIRVLDEQSGGVGAAAPVKGTEQSKASSGHVTGTRGRVPFTPPLDKGGASRFYYHAKAAKKEKNAGCDNLYWKRKSRTEWEQVTKEEWESLPDKERRQGNIHTTVKPVDLMRYLIRLVTPPGGTVLDPFMGSGTTGVAAKQEGFDFVGIELEEPSAAISDARIIAVGLSPLTDGKKTKKTSPKQKKKSAKGKTTPKAPKAVSPLPWSKPS